ncbi:ATP-binding cassette domain-containing protein [Bacillus lacus]|uniref:ATP-binding cassette domain-containing protein n=1 Tax=Metabacillus lacus TaxID=1983721 RepID=A0A7X2IXL2_9BACI|nr:ABC transporter ATP-binding protein [Metabacillus lacus]MRX71469.1 ATP-binding cassette domain-containing protein [Metabacillus lacus]
MSTVILKNIKKEFKGSTVFDSVNLTARSGKVIAIKGKSGVGKSTLLNIIAGLEYSSAGHYYFNNINMSEKNFNDLTSIRGESIGYISQHSPMIPKLSAFENICVPLWFKKEEKKIMNTKLKRIDKLSELFEVQSQLSKKIEMLSGGEIQRVGVIRSLINNPQLVVADEPTGALDDETALKVLSCFHTLKAEGVTIILATHSGIVAEQCDEVYHLTKDGLFLETV